MSWFILFIAGVFEIAWAVALKYSNGFTRIIPTVVTAVCLGCSMVLLAIALKKLPLGTAYAIWTGIGAAGTALLGMFLFNESKELIRLFFLGLIVIGILGLKMVN